MEPSVLQTTAHLQGGTLVSELRRIVWLEAVACFDEVLFLHLEDLRRFLLEES